MTSSDPDHLPEAPPPSATVFEVRASTPESAGGAEGLACLINANPRVSWETEGVRSSADVRTSMRRGAQRASRQGRGVSRCLYVSSPPNGLVQMPTEAPAKQLAPLQTVSPRGVGGEPDAATHPEPQGGPAGAAVRPRV